MFFSTAAIVGHSTTSREQEEISWLNQKIVSDCAVHVSDEINGEFSYPINTSDRAVLASLSGELAKKVVHKRNEVMVAQMGTTDTFDLDLSFKGNLKFTFTGSAGQGFGVFMTPGIDVELVGEANDSFCKSISGGKAVIIPPRNSNFNPSENSIVGNCALYGATGGTAYVYGLAGDRFAIRNSGALAVVEGTGLHACEYMTNGKVVVLGAVSQNVGAGMTGGELYLLNEYGSLTNGEYIKPLSLTDEEQRALKLISEDYFASTKSMRAQSILNHWEQFKVQFSRFVPIGVLKTVDACDYKAQAA